MALNENAKRAALIGLFLLAVAGVRWYSSRPSPVSPYLTTSPSAGSSRPVQPTPLPSFFDPPAAQPTSPNTRPSPVITQDSSSQNSSQEADRLNTQTEGHKALGNSIKAERESQNAKWKEDDEAAAEQQRLNKLAEERRIEEERLRVAAEEQKRLQAQAEKARQERERLYRESERRRLERRP